MSEVATLAEEQKDGVALFLPEPYDIVWSLIVLLIIAFFFYRYFMPKFQAIFDERASRIEGGMAKAEHAQQEAEAAKKKYEDQLDDAKIEAAKIRDDARNEASRIVADARAKAEADAAQITANAQQSIATAQQQAMVSLKGEVGALATALAGKILGAQLADTHVQSDMLNSMIDDIESESAARK